MSRSPRRTDEEYFQRPMRFFGFNRIVPFLRPYTKRLVWMTILAFIGTLFDIFIPQFQKYALDNFIAGETLSGFSRFVLIYVAFLLAQVAFNLVSILIAQRIELNINHDLRERCYRHLQELSLSYYNRFSVGYIHSRIMSDIATIGETTVWCILEGLWHGVYILGVAIAMFVMNWKLALVTVAILPVMAVLAVFFERKLVRVNRKIRELNSIITGDFNEGITGAKTIKTLAIEEKMRSEFREDTRNMRVYSVRKQRLDSFFFAVVSFSSSFALALVLWRGGIIAMDGLMLIGTLSVFMTYAMNLGEPIRALVQIISNCIHEKVNIERVTALLSEDSCVKDTPEVIARYGDAFTPKTENWEELRGDIEFCDVTFRYPDGEENVLEHFNLTVPFGTNVAIVGETGAGKSTLANLICRFFEPTEGAVLVDGRDLRERSQLWMHRAIGYVLQTPHLFSGTIAENLRYGNPDATDAELHEALRLVGADFVLDSMEQGLDSPVGEGGDLLSTGQKQLISFARAILAKPKILILDEATSSIDTITEQQIQRATRRLIQGRTSFVIAHRLSTVRDADVILVVRDGKIVESGKHADLLAKKGYYYELQHSQFREDATRAAYAD